MNTLAILNFLLLILGSGAEWVLEDLRVLAVSPEHARAVVDIPHRGRVLIEPGDRIAGGTVRVVAVLADRIVVEELIEEEGGLSRKRAWIEPTSEGWDEVRVRRLLDRLPPEEVLMLPTPQVFTFDTSSKAHLRDGSAKQNATSRERKR